MYKPRLKTRYNEEIIKNLQAKFAYKSPMQVPKLLKICINQGVNGAVNDKKLVNGTWLL